MIVWFGISTIFLLSYLYFIRYLLSGWGKAILAGTATPGNTPAAAVSLVIPVRNDAAALHQLLQSISQQSWFPDNFEILVVDDHSSDSEKLSENLSAIRQQHPALPLFYQKLPKGKKGKKAALYQGVLSSQHPLVITTDADTLLPPGWIKSMVRAFAQGKADMLIGPVKVAPAKTLLERFEQLDLVSLVTTAAATAGQGNPILCNGANLAFTREAFLQHHDKNAHYASGDDIFFLLNLKKQKNSHIIFNTAQEAMVCVAPSASIAGLINQRIRWASKSSGYKDAGIILTALLVWGYAVLLFLLAVLSFVQPLLLIPFIGLLSVKTLGDYLLFKKVADFFHLSIPLLSLVIFEVLYVVYVSFVGTLAHVAPFQWKGRKRQK